jgi:CRP-like cAMP-binding protein
MIRPGEMFGEAYVSPESGVLINDVVAEAESEVLFFDVKRILTVCPSACRFHATVIQNLFYAISEKNRKLVQKIGHMSKRTTRAKLLSYLSEEAKKQNSTNIMIPFNRQQLADFLSVDRSAMSNELCKMRDEGLLVFEKNEFTLFS